MTVRLTVTLLTAQILLNASCFTVEGELTALVLVERVHAIVNALVANEEMHGRLGRRVPALPRDRVVELLRAAGRI